MVENKSKAGIKEGGVSAKNGEDLMKANEGDEVRRLTCLWVLSQLQVACWQANLVVTARYL